MPYIKEVDRQELTFREPKTAGELNYKITQLCTAFILQHGENYGNINSVVGVLECAKMEFYRRLAAPYEDTKIAENGDVY